MKLKNNELNFCDYCKVDTKNAVSKLTETVCQCCEKFYCVACVPDPYYSTQHVPHQVIPQICKSCFTTVMSAHYKDSGFDAVIAWPKKQKKDLRASGNSSAIHFGEISAFILDKYIEKAKQEVLDTFKEIHSSSLEFLKKLKF